MGRRLERLEFWGAKLTSVFVRQGHYALDLANISTYPPADVTIERIGDLAGRSVSSLSGVA